jgi:hypothetical protein
MLHADYVDYEMKRALALLQVAITCNIDESDRDILARTAYHCLQTARENFKNQAEMLLFTKNGEKRNEF